VRDHLMGGESGAPFFVRLASDRYGRHLATKMLRVSVRVVRYRGVLFESCLKGNAAVMVRNAYGADVLDFAFQTTLNASQRAELVVELLFSRERKILEVVRSKLAGADAGGKVSFNVALAACGGDFRDMVVENAGVALAGFVDKPTLVRLGIVHAALDEYLQVLMDEYPAGKAKELCALLAPSLVHLAHTKAGISCAVTCVKVLDAKHRKKVVRSLKGHVRALVAEECGHRLLIALCEWVDDTKLVGRALTAELFSASKIAAEIAVQREEDVADSGGVVGDERILPGRVPKAKKGKGSEVEGGGERMDVDGEGDTVDVEYVKSLLLHKHGRMLFLALLFPRNTRYFHPALYGPSWEAVDEEKFGKTSKKDPAARRTELWAQFSDAVRQVIQASCRELLMSHWSAPVLIGAVEQEELRDVTTRCLIAELKAVVDREEDEEVVGELRRSVCAQKSMGVVFKVGGESVGQAVLKELGPEVVAKLGGIERWAATAYALLASTQSREAAKLVVKAKTGIEKACGAAGARLVAEATELKKGSKTSK
jgi:CPL (NUC119) domain